MVGGLLSATGLTLIVVPVLFTLLVRDRRATGFDLNAAYAEPPHPTTEYHP